MSDKQLTLFPVERPPVTRADIVLARRLVRKVCARGPLSEPTLVAILGCTWDQFRLAAGIAARWGRVARADGYVTPVIRDGEAKA